MFERQQRDNQKPLIGKGQTYNTMILNIQNNLGNE
jgi:hypothetical protein